jgi:thiol-disulfide isomerase/thioredoxin
VSAGLAVLLVAGLPQRGFARPAAEASTTPTVGEALQPSSPEQLALSDWLRQRGAIFYGAWWCPACFMQKNLFGKEAGNRLPYVECDKEEAGRQRCVAANVRAFPTWVLGSQRVEGVQTVEELKAWSGYPGSAAAPASPTP